MMFKIFMIKYFKITILNANCSYEPKVHFVFDIKWISYRHVITGYNNIMIVQIEPLVFSTGVVSSYS